MAILKTAYRKQCRRSVSANESEAMKKIMKIEEAGYLAAMAKWRNISGHQ
jgi:hypothetical protein